MNLKSSCRFARTVMKIQIRPHCPNFWTKLSFVRHCSNSQTLPQPKKLDHLTLTANQFRQMKIHKARVTKVVDLSKRVRSLTLSVRDPDFTFKAGQWVDFFIPNVEPVVGLSITSAPHSAEKDGIVDLAIRYSEYPPTKWIHTECKPGQEVEIRVGGEFYYDPENSEPDPRSNLLLIGGGVGINPMVSIARHYVHLKKTANEDLREKLRSLHLYYSVKTEDDLVFQKPFRELSEEMPSFKCKFYVTRQQGSSIGGSDSNVIHYRRISEEDVANALWELKPEPVVSYVCGPNRMIDRASKLLYRLGMLPERVKFEKWW